MPNIFQQRGKSVDYKQSGLSMPTGRNRTILNQLNSPTKSDFYQTKYSKFSNATSVNLHQKQRLDHLLKLKEEIESQQLSQKKAIMMKKVEDVNLRKQNILTRKKAECVKSSILKYGMRKLQDDNYDGSIQTELSISIKMEMFKMQREIVKEWLR